MFRSIDRLKRLCPDLRKIKVLLDDEDFRQFEQMDNIEEVDILLRTCEQLLDFISILM